MSTRMPDSPPLSRPPRCSGPGRPPRQHAGGADTRDALIRCGVALLTARSFAATSIGEVLAQLHVPKGSFYHYFDSKEAFGCAVIEHYSRYFANKLDRLLLDTSLPPLARIRRFIDEACAGMARHQFERGCLIGNLGQEMSSLPETFRARLEATFVDWQQRLAVCLDEARRAGQLRADCQCAELAAFFWIGWEGAVLRAKLVRDVAPLQVFAEGFFAGLPYPPPA